MSSIRHTDHEESSKEKRYFYAQAAMDKYYVIDKQDEAILASCETENYATRVVGALNFNDQPGDYGFGEQTLEEHERS